MDKTVKTILKIGGIFAATQVYEVLELVLKTFCSERAKKLSKVQSAK